MSKQLKSNLLILLGAFIWGTAFLAQKDGGQIGTFTFNGIRFLIGGTFLLPVIYVLDRLREHDRGARPGTGSAGSPEDADMSWNKTVFKGGVILGVILFIASSVQQYGILYTTLGKAGFITALYTILVPLFSVFLGKKIRPLIWIAVALGMAGLYLISMFGESLKMAYGDRFMIACAFGFAVQILVIDHYSPMVDPVKLSAVEFLTLGVISLFFMFTFEDPTPEKIISVLPSLLYAGILSSGVAYTLQIVGQRYAEPTQAAIIMCMESVFSLLTGFVVLGERLAVHEYIGAALIFIAVLLSQLPEKKSRP